MSAKLERQGTLLPHHHYHPRTSSPHLIALFSFQHTKYASSTLGRGGRGKERGRARRGGGKGEGDGEGEGEGEGEGGGREKEWGGRGIFKLSLSLGHSKAGSTFFHYVL